MANLRKTSITFLKLAISILLIYFIFTKIDVSEIKHTLQRSNPIYLLAALGFFSLSKGVAALRLNTYFHQLDILLTQKSNLKLYFLGMFYNLFLPGGIGGDAYKGYLIKKSFKVPTKKVISVLVLDRLSGLLLLFIYACALLLYIDYEYIAPYNFIFALGIPISLATFWGLNKYFFDYVLPVFWKSTLYSALVQLAQLISVWFIMQSLGVTTDQIAYPVIFLVSSIVSVLPLTIGGIGSREVTFFYGASWLGLDENISVGISITFFLITAMVSFIGIWYHFKQINLEVISQRHED